MNKSEQFINLVKENPSLPIMPMVSCNFYMNEEDDHPLAKMGMLVDSEVREYYIGGTGEVYFKDESTMTEVVSDLAGCDYGCDQHGREIGKLSEEEQEEIYDSVPWKKAIVMLVDVGNEEDY